MLKFIRFIKFIILASSPFGYPNGNFFTKDTLRPDETDDNLPYEKVGNNEPVCIADEVPFDIPDTWEWCRLSVVAQLLDGKKINGESHPYLEAKYLRGRAIPTIKTSGKYVEKNTKVILVDGENSGEVFTLSECGYLGSTFKVLYSTSEICTNYLLLFLLLQKQFLRQNKVGAAIPHLNKNIFFSLFFPLPPYEEQIRIVEQYNALIPFVDNYGVLENKLDILNASFPELLKKSILQEAVQGKLVPQDPNDEPASVLLERIRAEKQALIKAGKIKKDKNESIIFRRDNSHYEKRGSEEVCIDDEIPFEIPDTWEWCRLGNILTKLTDGTHSTPKYTNTGIPFISVKDISSGKLNFNDCKYISIDEHQELYSRCNPELNDILLTKVGTTGIPVIVDTEKQFSLFVSVALLKFNNELIFNKYVVQLINSPLVQKQVIKNTRGVGNKNWVMRDIANTLIAIPPSNEQHRIVAKLDEYFILINQI